MHPSALSNSPIVVKSKSKEVMIKRYALHSVAIVVLSTICFVWSMLRYALLGRGTAGCSANFRFCPHSPCPCLEEKAPSCCHALEARFW